MTWFQRFLLLTIALTFVLVVVGGTVRATDSGLGCPDWPLCHGELIPPAEKHTLIEFSHRTMASIVGFAFLGVTFFAFKTERRGHPLAFWLAFAAGLLLVVQIVLGGITVKRELPAEVVALHLATAMSFMGVLIAAFIVSLAKSHEAPPLRAAGTSPFARMAAVTAVAAFATLVLGSYISGTDASLACGGWPLCNGSLMPGGDSAQGLHWLHRLVAGLLGLLLVATAWLVLDEHRPPLIQWTIAGAGVVYITQVMVGAANIWTDLAAGVVVMHLSLAALLWCMMVAVSVAAWYLPGRAMEAATQHNVNERARKASGWAR